MCLHFRRELRQISPLTKRPLYLPPRIPSIQARASSLQLRLILHNLFPKPIDRNLTPRRCQPQRNQLSMLNVVEREPLDLKERSLERVIIARLEAPDTRRWTHCSRG